MVIRDNKINRVQILFALLFVTSLCSGCASNALMDAGLKGKLDHYNVSEVKNAYRTDDQLAIHYSAKRKRIGFRQTRDFFTVYELDSKTHLPARIIYVAQPVYSSSDKIRIVNSLSYANTGEHEEDLYPVLVVDINDRSLTQKKMQSPDVMACLYVTKESDVQNSQVIYLRDHILNREPELRVVFLPITLTFDFLTLPIQIFPIMGEMWDW